MNLKLKKALKVFSNTLVILVIVFVFLLYGIQLFGLKPYSVLSGSMQSVYPTGSLLYVKNVETQNLAIGDVITYKMAGGDLCTHRIIEIVPDKNNPETIKFRTKGDENDTADPLVNSNAVIGKAVFCIPILGFLTTYISTPLGKYITVLVFALFILFEIVLGLILDRKNKNQN